MPRALWSDPYAAQTIDLLQEPARARAAAVQKIADAQARAQEIAGNAQANAQLQSGQAWAGAIGGITKDVAGIPGQIMQAREQSQKDALQKLQIAQAQGQVDAQQRAVGAQSVLSNAMRASVDPSAQPQGPDQSTANGVIAQIPTFLKPDDNGVSLWDAEGLSKYMASKGYGDMTPSLMKDIGGVNDAFRSEASAKQQTLQRGADLVQRGNYSPLLATAFIHQLKVNGSYDPAKLEQLGQMVGTPEFKQIVDAYATPLKIENAPAGSAARIMNGPNPGQVAPGSVVPEKEPPPEFKPPEGKVALGPDSKPLAFDSRTGKWTDSAGSVVAPSQITFTGKDTAASKPGTVEDWVERARRQAVQQNGGVPLSDAQMQAVDTKAMQSFKETNADPELRAAALAQRNISQLLAQSQLNQTPTKEQAASVAEDLVNHRIAPEQLVSLFSTRGKEGLAFKLAVTTEAKKLDPNFNFEQASADYGFSKSAGFQQTTRLLGSVLESMPRLEANAEKLGNGNFRTWNQLSNAAANQFNSTDLKRMKTDALLVGDEVAKILTGGGTGSATSDSKLKQATDIFSTSDSVPAIAAAMDEVKTLLSYRRTTLTRGTYLEGAQPSAPTSGVKILSITPIKP